MDAWRLNTVVSSLMVFLNQLTEAWEGMDASRRADGNLRALMADALLAFAVMLSPVAPHVAEELWHFSGQQGFVMHSRWPAYDERHLALDEVEYGISVNGKPRSRITVPVDTPDEEVQARALADGKILPHLEGKQVVKVIVIRGRLVNIVVK